MKSLPAALLALFLSLPAFAQGGDAKGAGDGGDASGGVVTEGMVRYEQRPQGLFEIVENPNGTTKERLLTPEEVASRKKGGELAAVSGAHLCRGEAFPHPRRLAPGQVGSLRVLVTLAGKAVVLPGSPAGLTLKPIAGFQFGTPVLEPAKPGRLDGKFQGRPVYDDTMLFQVPLTVGPEVKAQEKYFVEGTLRVELHDSNTGNRLGSFESPITGRIDIGSPLPGVGAVAAPGPAGAAPGGAPDPAGAGTPGQAAKAGATGAAGGLDARTGVVEGERTPAAAGPDPVLAGDPALEEEGGPVGAAGGRTALFWGLGVLAVVILTLIIRQRR